MELFTDFISHTRLRDYLPYGAIYRLYFTYSEFNKVSKYYDRYSNNFNL